jgi:HAD superfamily hydrolase (TIGR01509 family)
MPKAVLFDIDGTLIDSNDQHAQCWVETFAHFDLHISFDQVRGQIGKGGDQLLPALLPQRVVDEQEEAITGYRKQLFADKFMDSLRPFPGATELCKTLAGQGIAVVLASSGSKSEVERHIKTLGIGGVIRGATSADDAEESKPEPDIFQAALKLLAPISAGEAVVVGDTPYDAEAAGKAGLRCVGVLCGGFPEADLRRAGCMAVYDGPEDLLRQLTVSPLAAVE